MDKSQIAEKIISLLEQKRSSAISAANQAHETATHTETVAKSKYETFGLEASYLAHGQAKRVEECEADLAAFSSMTLKDFSSNTPLGVSALVTIEDELGQLKTCFIALGGGGVKLNIGDLTHANGQRPLASHITVITPSSPLGRALMGRTLHDEIRLTINNQISDYEIVSLM